MIFSIGIIINKTKALNKMLDSFGKYFRLCLFALLFTCCFVRGSLKQALVDIFSGDGFDPSRSAWIDSSDNELTQNLRNVGMELFRAASFRPPFEQTFNDAIDIFQFVKTIQEMDASLVINKPEMLSKYDAQTHSYWQEIAQNPLGPHDQEKIIKMQKFLHFFTVILNDRLVFSSDEIAQKIGLKNYMFFHDHYVKYALKISISNGRTDALLKTYSACVDPFFKILASYDEKASDNFFWFEGSNSWNIFRRCPLNLLIYELSIRNGQDCDHNLVNSLYSSRNRDCPIEKTVQAPIHKLILSATHIQKYVRQAQAIDKYNKKKAHQTLQTYIKGWSAYCKLETLRQEEKFKIDPSKVMVPNLPLDIWDKIICFSLESIGSLIFVNNFFNKLISSTINGIKKEIAIDKTEYKNAFIQEIQSIDASIVFELKSYLDVFRIPFNEEKRKQYFIDTIRLPLDSKNKEKIKAIRQCIYAIKTDAQEPSEITAKILNLKNYGFFYDQYFSYGLKILAYQSFFNIPRYYEEYTECLDPNFYLEIKSDFVSEFNLSFNVSPSNYSLNYPTDSQKEDYSIETEGVSRSDIQAEKVRLRPSDLLESYKKYLACDIPNPVISYFQNPTYLKKKVLLDNGAQQALVATQAFIRTYNAIKKLPELEALQKLRRILTLQRFIRSFNSQEYLAQLVAEALRVEKQKADALSSIQNSIKSSFDALAKSYEQNNQQQRRQRYYKVRRFIIASGILTSFCLFYSSFLQKMFFSIS
jgi:hypothetical protein